MYRFVPPFVQTHWYQGGCQAVTPSTAVRSHETPLLSLLSPAAGRGTAPSSREQDACGAGLSPWGCCFGEGMGLASEPLSLLGASDPERRKTFSPVGGDRQGGRSQASSSRADAELESCSAILAGVPAHSVLHTRDTGTVL